MPTVADIAAALGPGLLRVLVDQPVRQAGPVTDVVIAEPGDDGRLLEELGTDLVFGPGIQHTSDAVQLVARCAAGGACGVALRRPVARARAVRGAARAHRIALLELADSASLVHVVGLVQQVIERAGSVTGVPGGGAEAALLALADAAAELVHAPVTIEDAASRVVAYSSHQDVTDTTRVSTIVGRRVPAATVAALRSRGVFRRLARSGRPFLVPPGRGLETARYVVPVRSGGEWLGSVWAVVEREPPDDVVVELQRTASLIAVHLLRARAMADLTRSLGVERLRTLLDQGAPVSGDSLTWLPDGPWRAVALGPGGEAAADPPPTGPGEAAAETADVDVSLDAWESRFRRARWSQPLLTDLGGHPFAVVSAEPAPAARAARPGSWDWLVQLVGDDGSAGAESGLATGDGLGSWVAGGQVAPTVGDLPVSARGASEVAALRRQGSVSDAAATVEQQWARLTVVRAVAAVEVVGPVAALADHDRVHHTDYLASLGAWLDYGGQPKEAARSLGVHVNTLRHRMVRMSQVVAMDLDDPLERLALRLQLMASDSARL